MPTPQAKLNDAIKTFASASSTPSRMPDAYYEMPLLTPREVEWLVCLNEIYGGGGAINGLKDSLHPPESERKNAIRRAKDVLWAKNEEAGSEIQAFCDRLEALLAEKGGWPIQ